MILPFNEQEKEFLFLEEPMILKQRIMTKLDKLLWDVHELLISEGSNLIGQFSEWKRSPKGKVRIFKGENYLGLPWIAIDHMAYYDKNKSLAYRILIVWGKGAYFNFLAEELVEPVNGMPLEPINKLMPITLINSNDRWIQHTTPSNSMIVDKPEDAIQLRKELGYTRLVEHIPFNEFESLDEISRAIFRNHLTWMLLILQETQPS